MRGSEQLPLRLIDLLGGSAVAACALGFVWFVAVGNDRAGAEIRKLTSLIDTARRDTRSLQLSEAGQRAILDSRREKLSKSGQLPVEAPIEEYFQVLSALCKKHDLRVIQHGPLPSQSYPGLVEQRYTYEVEGSTLDLVRFLKSIEDADFWADVSYLTISQGKGPRHAARAVVPAASETNRAALTISVFSAAPPESLSKDGDT